MLPDIVGQGDEPLMNANKRECEEEWHTICSLASIGGYSRFNTA